MAVPSYLYNSGTDKQKEAAFKERLTLSTKFGEKSFDEAKTTGFDFAVEYAQLLDSNAPLDCLNIFVLGGSEVIDPDTQRYEARIYEKLTKALNYAGFFVCGGGAYTSPKLDKLSFCLTFMNPSNPKKRINISNTVGLQDAHIIICAPLASYDINAGYINFALGHLIKFAQLPYSYIYCIGFASKEEFLSHYNANEYKTGIKKLKEQISTLNLPSQILANIFSSWSMSIQGPSLYNQRVRGASTSSNKANFIDTTIAVSSFDFACFNYIYQNFYRSEIAQTQMSVQFFSTICKTLSAVLRQANTNAIFYNLQDYGPPIVYLLNKYEHKRAFDADLERFYAFVPMRFDLDDPDTRFSLFCLCNLVSIFCGYRPYYEIDFTLKSVKAANPNKRDSMNGFMIPTYYEWFALASGIDLSNQRKQSPQTMDYYNMGHYSREQALSTSSDPYPQIPNYPCDKASTGWQQGQNPNTILPTNWSTNALMANTNTYLPISANYLFNTNRHFLPDVITINKTTDDKRHTIVNTLLNPLSRQVKFTIDAWTSFLFKSNTRYTDFPRDSLYALSAKYGDLASVLVNPDCYKENIAGLRLYRQF
jgi:hypothetical protein